MKWNILQLYCARARARINVTLKHGRFLLSSKLVKRSDRRTTFDGSFYNDNMPRERNISVCHCHKRTASRLKQRALDKSLFPIQCFSLHTLRLFFANHFALRETEQNCNRCATWCTDCTDEVTTCAKYLSIQISAPLSLSFSLPIIAQAPRSYPPHRPTLKVRGVSWNRALGGRMYFSEGLILVKVETRHNGDTRTPRKYRTKNLSANVSACEDTDEEIHERGRLDERRLGGARKEEHSLCARIH